MGCGSSSLKGDAPAGVAGGESEPAPRLKKVATNFNTPDYDTGAKARRMTEYAPHETERQTSDAGPETPAGPASLARTGLKDADGNDLKPYETLSDSQDQTYPHERANAGSTSAHVNGDTTNLSSPNPTSQSAKDQFASTNDPANHAGANGTDALTPPANSNSTPPDGLGKERKRSWLGQKYKNYADAKDGRNQEISEEELKKYTGMDKTEMQKMVEKGEGVGGGQSASNTTPRPGGGLVGSAAWGSG